MKVLSVVGARPQFIKCGPVSESLRARATEILVHTGQHYDAAMSSVFFRELGLPDPDVNLGVGSGSHAQQTAAMLTGLETLVLDHRPDWVVVYGDTNSTLAGALAAAKLHVPVAHVEAGLRSFNRRMPEELNRVVTDHLSTLLFCPTSTAVDNLATEGIRDGVHHTGDVMFDAIARFAPLATRQSSILDTLALRPGGYAVATIHRAETTDHRALLDSVGRALTKLSSNGLPVVLPMHPRTRRAFAEHGIGLPAVRVIDPLSYLDMLALVKQARVTLTDSGGLQKESCWLGVPCVTLRNETEWVETVRTGWNVLAGTDEAAIVSAATAARPASTPAPSADAGASERIVDLLCGAARGGR